MDHASQCDERGSVNTFDAESYAAYSGWDEDDIAAVLTAMRNKGVISKDGRLTAWEKRQPQREDDSTPRVRALRDRQRDGVTQGNAAQRTVTQHNAPDKIREDSDKEAEKKTNDDDDAPAPVDAATAKAFTAFQNDIHLIASPIQAEEMTDVLDRLKARNALDWWHMAVKIACDNNARKWSYVKAVLENALRDGRAPGTHKPRQNGHGASHPRADTRDGYRVPEGYEDVVNTDVRTVSAPDPWRDLLAEADALAVMVRETPQVKERTMKQLTRKLDGIMAALPVPYDAALAELGERLA
jgi:DnaD/phage-associated family protein